MKDWENAKIDCESDFGNKNNQLRTGYFFTLYYFYIIQALAEIAG